MNYSKTRAELQQEVAVGTLKLSDPDHEVYTTLDFSKKFQPKELEGQPKQNKKKDNTN